MLLSQEDTGCCMPNASLMPLNAACEQGWYLIIFSQNTTAELIKCLGGRNQPCM